MFEYVDLAPRCVKILPLAYDDSLTYYEAICQMCAKVNELIAYVESFDTEIITEAKSYTDTQITSLQTQIYAKYDKEIADLDGKYVDNFNEINEKLIELNSSLAKLYSYFEEYKGFIDAKFELMYVELKNYIDETVSNLTRLYVISPVTGQLTEIQNVLSDMYDYSRCGALTAIEYENLNLTSEQYDGKMITGKQYDTFLRFVLFDSIYLSMFSPFNGVKMSVFDVINSLANLHKDNDYLTASGYDAKLLTASLYDGKLLTAFQYDWHAKTLIA